MVLVADIPIISIFMRPCESPSLPLLHFRGVLVVYYKKEYILILSQRVQLFNIVWGTLLTFLHLFLNGYCHLIFKESFTLFSRVLVYIIMRLLDGSGSSTLAFILFCLYSLRGLCFHYALSAVRCKQLVSGTSETSTSLLLNPASIFDQQAPGPYSASDLSKPCFFRFANGCCPCAPPTPLVLLPESPVSEHTVAGAYNRS